MIGIHSSACSILRDGWYIPHPGTLEPVKCESFEQAMEKWFEGFNIPFQVKDGKRESFKTACKRVSEYLKPKI